MATFYFVKPISGKSSASGKSSPYSLLKNRIEAIKEEYTDFNGNVLDAAYYETIANEYIKAIQSDGYTANQKGDMINALTNIQKEYRGWQVKNHKLYNASISSIQSDLENDWRSIWKYNIKNMDIGVMTEDMLTAIEIAKGQLNEFKNILQEETAETDKIELMDDILNYLEDRETMWRGVQVNPSGYALVFDTDKDGVRELNVKRLNEVPDGYYKLPEVDYGGVKVFANTSGEIDEEGNEKIYFGNGVWKGTVKSGFIYDADLSGSDTFDVKSVRNVPFLSYQAGTVFKKPDNSFYVFDGEGQYTEYANEELLKQDGFDSSNSVSLTEAESEKIRRQFNVNLIDKPMNTRTKQAEIQSKLQGVWNDTYNQLNPSFKEKYGAEAGARAIRDIPEFLSPMVKDTGEFLSKNPVQILAKNINFKEAGKNIVSGLEKVPRLLQKATGVPAMMRTTKAIFRGLFGKDE